jgi:hypothetical protein
MIPLAFAQRILLPDVPELHMKALCIEALTTASKFIAYFTPKVATISAARLRLLWHFETGVGILLQRNGNTCTYRNCEFRNLGMPTRVHIRTPPTNIRAILKGWRRPF